MGYVERPYFVTTFLAESEIGADFDWTFKFEKTRLGGGDWRGIWGDYLGSV